jgi:hypothetical protein
MTMTQKISDESPVATPVVIPSMELSGTPAERLRALDAAIARLQTLRRTIAGDATPAHPHELHGPYLRAPVWPWFVAGWIIGALFVLMFVLARAFA